ncbi:MAG: UPF0175 family protein [Betaproteobacteria bacterium]|nr:UPF0175 family protein [Betaproteobacteria bacterium]
MHLQESLAATEASLRPGLASSLYCDGVLSLGAAARLSGMALSDFVRHLGSLGIEIVRADETTSHEAGDVSAWLSS